MESDFTWAENNGCQEVRSEYEYVNFVRIDNKIHIRSKHLSDEPFAEIDPETCKIKENFTKWTSDDNLLNWTNDRVPDGDAERGYRKLNMTQMHYLNNELWVIAAYWSERSEDGGSLKQYVIEVWEREGHHFSRKQEIPLFMNDGTTPWRGAKRYP